MSAAILIDLRTRKLSVYAVSVTQAAENSSNLVLRFGAELGTLARLLSGNETTEWDHGEYVTHRRFQSDIPIILMGGYEAMSSAGHARIIHGCQNFGPMETTYGYKPVTVVGGLGAPFMKKGGLRILSVPIQATLIRGQVTVSEVPTFENSNCATASAVEAGVQILAKTDRKSVFVQEGQSDTVSVFRFRGTVGSPTVFPTEHREAMFSSEKIARVILLGQSRSALRRNRDEDDEPPTEAEIREVAGRRLEEFLKEEDYTKLGRGIDHHLFWPETSKVFKKLWEDEFEPIEAEAESD